MFCSFLKKQFFKFQAWLYYILYINSLENYIFPRFNFYFLSSVILFYIIASYQYNISNLTRPNCKSKFYHSMILGATSDVCSLVRKEKTLWDAFPNSTNERKCCTNTSHEIMQKLHYTIRTRKLSNQG